MMRILALAGVAALAAGCGGGVTKEEMQTMRQELLAHEAQESAKLRSELTGVDQKYVTTQQLQLKVEKQLKDMEELSKQMTELSKALQVKVDLANTNVLKVLEFEERLLADRLASLRGMIEELKKK
jgi:small-conductance mechanosensitive channel